MNRDDVEFEFQVNSFEEFKEKKKELEQDGYFFRHNASIDEKNLEETQHRLSNRGYKNELFLEISKKIDSGLIKTNLDLEIFVGNSQGKKIVIIEPGYSLDLKIPVKDTVSMFYK